MYNNIKTRSRGFSERNRSNSGGRRGQYGNNRPSRSNGMNPSLYINKANTEVEPEVYTPKHAFKDFALSEAILSQVARRGYVTPTPIQDQAIPEILNGKDVIGLANTGTGKTAAFLLPLLNKLQYDRGQNTLIIVPTRELAVQIDDELRAFTPGMQVFSAVCIGGAGFGNQVRALQRRPQFVIGTPGRLKDHLNRRTLRLDNVHNLVIDEADRLVEMGFINDVRTIVSQLPAERQTLFFSATMMPEVKNLVHSFLKDPLTISVRSRDTASGVDQDVVRFTDSHHKFSLLHEMLVREEFKKVLIFGRTKHGVEKLHEALVERGVSSVSIHGNKNQAQRQRSLNDFKANHTQVMVATDVAARGLDIPDVTHVINYDLPENYSDYIHRIGRTGRANKKGQALTFVQ